MCSVYSLDFPGYYRDNVLELPGSWFEGEVLYCEEGFPGLVGDRYSPVGGDFKNGCEVCIVDFRFVAE